MLGLIAVALTGLVAFLVIKRTRKGTREDIATPKTNERMKRLWRYVETNFRAGKYRATERALLSILKVDHKNTAAYNRLGMIYAKQQKLDEAIECFDIASSLTPTLATLYNLGLVHFEKGNFRQAAAAFERVVDLQPSVKRYIAFAKAHEKMGNHKKVAEILQEVVKMEPSAPNQELLAQAFARIKEYEQAEELRRKAALKRTRKAVKERESAQPVGAKRLG